MRQKVSGHRFKRSLQTALSRVYDFLHTDLFIESSKNPLMLRKRVLAPDASTLQHPIIFGEVQKVPHLFDEAHWLIENSDAQFILCGSSARKLKIDPKFAGIFPFFRCEGICARRINQLL